MVSVLKELKLLLLMNKDISTNSKAPAVCHNSYKKYNSYLKIRTTLYCITILPHKLKSRTLKSLTGNVTGAKLLLIEETVNNPVYFQNSEVKATVFWTGQVSAKNIINFCL